MMIDSRSTRACRERLTDHVGAAHDRDVLAPRGVAGACDCPLDPVDEDERVARRLLLGPVRDNEERHAPRVLIAPSPVASPRGCSS
jgi:hypothetical protein